MATSSADGFSLIEVLIALFVLAVGVIGAAGMQLTALRMAQQAAFQSTALHLALDMAEMMRGYARRRQLDDASNPYLAIDMQALVEVTPTEFADVEISRWLQRVRDELPGARVRICRDAQAWDAVAGQYRWACIHTPNAAITIKIGWPDKTQQEQSAGGAHKHFAPVIVMPIVLPAI